MVTNTELTAEQKKNRLDMIKKSWQARKNTVQRVVLSPIEDANEIPETLVGG